MKIFHGAQGQKHSVDTVQKKKMVDQHHRQTMAVAFVLTASVCLSRKGTWK